MNRESEPVVINPTAEDSRITHRHSRARPRRRRRPRTRASRRDEFFRARMSLAAPRARFARDARAQSSDPEGNQRTPRARADAAPHDDWFSSEDWSTARRTPTVRSHVPRARDPDSAYGNGRRARRDDDEDGSPSKRKGGGMMHLRATVGVDAESALSVVDEAIDAVIVRSIGATSAAVHALSRGASYLGEVFDSAGGGGAERMKKKDDDAVTPRGKEHVFATPRAMRFDATPSPSVRRDDDAREIETLRRRLADADAALRQRDRVVDDLKRQNLAIQRRQVARETKSRGEDDETRALVEQLRAQVESLMSEKAALARENARLARENGDLHAFARGASSDTEEYDAASDAGSSEIGNLNPEEMMKLEREIAEMEASLENSTLEYAAANSSMDRSDDGR